MKGETPKSTIKYRPRDIQTHSNGTTAPSPESLYADYMPWLATGRTGICTGSGLTNFGNSFRRKCVLLLHMCIGYMPPGTSVVDNHCSLSNAMQGLSPVCMRAHFFFLKRFTRLPGKPASACLEHKGITFHRGNMLSSFSSVIATFSVVRRGPIIG